MPRSQFGYDIKIPKIKIPKVAIPKLRGLNYNVSSREPLPAKVKNAVRERAKNTCEYRGCKYKDNLQFHHKNMKNNDNRVSNIELLCPNHHAKRHNDKIRKIVGRDILTGRTKTRLVKKPKKKPTKRKVSKKKTTKKTTRRRKPKSPLDVDIDWLRY